MPIKFAWKKLPVDEAGKSYDSLDAFQKSEIGRALNMPDGPEYDRICHNIVEKKAIVIEILELTMDARPASRGVKKPRKPKATEAQPELPKVA